MAECGTTGRDGEGAQPGRGRWRGRRPPLEDKKPCLLNRCIRSYLVDACSAGDERPKRANNQQGH